MKRILILILLTSLIFSISAQAADPIWLLLERGRQAVRSGELGEAFTIFRQIQAQGVEDGILYPEADLWLGYIFEQEGEWGLAEAQYQKVVDNRSSLYIKDDVFTVLYRLANIYETSSRYGQYESTLKDILDLGKPPEDVAIDPFEVAKDEAMYRVFIRDGFDKLFLLYREDERKYQLANQKLGVFSYKTGLYRESVHYLIQALTTPITNMINKLRANDYSFEFSGTEDLFTMAIEDKDLSDYMNETHVAESLYYLGASLFAYGELARSEEIWNLLLIFPRQYTYRQRAIRQLSSPFIEPLLLPQMLPE